MKTVLKSITLAGLGALALAGAANAEEKTLTVYTYDSFTAEWGPGPKIEEAFEKTCDCDLRWVAIDSSIGILSRLKLEGDNSDADVALGLDLNLLQQAKDTGLFAQYGNSPENLSLPMDWQDDTFVPFDYGYFAFIHDTESMPNPPHSLDALVNAPDDLSIVIQDPRTSTPGLGLLLWMKKVYGADAQAAWAKLAPKVVTATKSWSEAYGMFLEGEADMVLSYTTSPAYHMIVEETDKYRAAAFDEGHYIQVEVAAKTKNAPSPELADRFMEFITSEDFQGAIPTGNWMFPVIDLDEDLPDAFDQLMTPGKTLLIDSADVAENRNAWTREWLDAMSR